MPPPSDTVKVAIQWPGAFPKLMEIDQKKPLSAIIKEVSDGWSIIQNHEELALQYAEGPGFYITEKNRNEIKNGAILRLTSSPTITAQQLHDRVQSSSMDVKLEGLKDLARSSRDITFAQEFINLDGIYLLTQMVESSNEKYQKLQKIMKPCLGEMLSYSLTAFVELMDHGIVSWDTFSVAFIKKIASFVNKLGMDVSVLQRSLAILESMVLNSHDLYQKVAQEISIGQLIPLLQGIDQEIQTYAIAVINALFLKAPDATRQHYVEDSIDILDFPLSEMANILTQKQLRSIILTHVIRSQNGINNEMAHQLYVLQVLTFNLLEDRMMTKMDPQDQAQRDIIFELRRIAFDVEQDQNNLGGSIEKRKSMYTRDYKKLGFTNNVNPALDFTHTPPGMLALDNMLYFAKHHQDAYIRIVLENSSREDKHECPFGRSSIELTKMLCEILKVGELPSETCNDFHPMFFTHDRSFEEFFCICIQLLNKTWKEMRATSEDFNKVMQVVKEQIMRALTNKPNSLDQFKSRLQNLSYTEILKIRQSERMNQEDFQSRPILELKEKIQPEILELIKQQRLNRLVEGTCFRKLNSRRRQDKFWYCRLSPNHKVLHYGDLEESPQGEVPHDNLQDKLPVADIKAILTGKDCPHMKEKGALKQNKELLELAFSVMYDSNCQLNFIAPDKHEYCIWTDGLNALLGKDMVSDQTRNDMDTLLSMEIKLRLLDLENIQIPDVPPPIPKEPSNYDFVYDCN
ncbi:engulfment and cell motility protein 1 isoform X1 [Hyla sarda]|uniref:engulfment and cell motility protein 1 isoform X1 n=2 Tax=Hyla sarda TaxID=327740 RepID=UPI0024C34B47|nr:engulfment and cell motility protein 1 isoform X1 [Hyla sarda]XP_056376445.1 engulfment and cell motility protein 1 isoform X1 [Hyla sarda]XP_056376446.1 engulfment and cell motility protein 1 isoform X1 [Hyla sarda]